MAKFKTLAIEATVEDVITSALGAAQYVVQKYGKGAKVFACGTSGLIQELKDAGATVVEPKYVSDSTTNSSGPSLVPAGELDMDIKAVVAGADWTLTHRKLSYATLCLTCIPNCEFVATNRDRLVPASGTQFACFPSLKVQILTPEELDGRKYPGAGATVGALENVTLSRSLSRARSLSPPRTLFHSLALSFFLSFSLSLSFARARARALCV
jgi:ribonucleotide monophosphatase NagD (HAD superfamily)